MTMKMEKMKLTTVINAPREKVWHTMLDDASYQEWTKAFSGSSRYEGEWKEGAKMHFIGCDPETGKEGGMVSVIKEVRPYEFVSIEHIGVLEDGKEVTSGPAVEGWAGAFENYSFKEVAGGTELTIDQDIQGEHKQMFTDMWAKGLESLKKLAEQK